MKIILNVFLLTILVIGFGCEKDAVLDKNNDEDKSETMLGSEDSSTLQNGGNSNDSADNSPDQNDSSYTIIPDTLSTLIVTVKNFKSSQGQVLFGLYSKAEDFPEKDRTYDALIVEAQKDQLITEMDSIEAGQYALSVHHDENQNGKIDQNVLGIPQEGFGFSKDASGTFGPPKFDNAKFTVQESEDKELTVTLQYY